MAARMRSAEASVEVDAAQLVESADFRELENLGFVRKGPTIGQRVRYGFDAAHPVVLCKRAVDGLFTTMGGHALRASNSVRHAYGGLLRVSSNTASNPNEISTLSCWVQFRLVSYDPFVEIMKAQE